MFYINELRNPSFPIGLVKIESDFIVRSVETGLGRWTLVLAVIAVLQFMWKKDFLLHGTYL